MQKLVGGVAQDAVLGMGGAVCPWLISWSIDDPTGVEKNELFMWEGGETGGTLRTLNDRCANACVTAPAPAPARAGSAAPAASLPASPSSAFTLASQYALARFVYAVQGRSGVDSPIPFNGMLFTAQEGHGGPADVDYRQWGPNHWFQNTRFPYEQMLANGDVEEMRVVLDWTATFVPLARARTALLLPPGESGIFMTETVDTFGLFQGGEYGCDSATNRPEGYPAWLEGPGSEGGWVRYDYGGNGFAEAGLMALDYYFTTLDLEGSARYIPFATEYVDFYSSHYRNRTEDGRLMIWPAQVLEVRCPARPF